MKHTDMPKAAKAPKTAPLATPAADAIRSHADALAALERATATHQAAQASEAAAKVALQLAPEDERTVRAWRASKDAREAAEAVLEGARAAKARAEAELHAAERAVDRESMEGAIAGLADTKIASMIRALAQDAVGHVLGLLVILRKLHRLHAHMGKLEALATEAAKRLGAEEELARRLGAGRVQIGASPCANADPVRPLPVLYSMVGAAVAAELETRKDATAEDRAALGLMFRALGAPGAPGHALEALIESQGAEAARRAVEASESERLRADRAKEDEVRRMAVGEVLEAGRARPVGRKVFDDRIRERRRDAGLPDEASQAADNDTNDDD